jgi:CRISPR-associated protein (TIGR03986 family)
VPDVKLGQLPRGTKESAVKAALAEFGVTRAHVPDIGASFVTVLDETQAERLRAAIAAGQIQIGGRRLELYQPAPTPRPVARGRGVPTQQGAAGERHGAPPRNAPSADRRHQPPPPHGEPRAVNSQEFEPEQPPYGFVPVRLERAVTEAPVLHDGRLPNDCKEEDLVSGELCCTLQTLTPMLAGCHQYEAKDVEGANAVHQNLSGASANDEKPKVRLPQEWGNCEVPADKKILEPLLLADGRVAVAGTALKGMLRQSLGALLSAPMERVGERTYSYRPNLQVINGSALRWPSAAIVDTPPAADGSGMTVFPVYAHPRGEMSYRRDTAGRPYEGSLDGAGILKNEFDQDMGRVGSRYTSVDIHTHPPFLVVGPASVPIPKELVVHYWKTLDHLEDSTDGHIASRHPLIRGDERERGALRKAIETSIEILRTSALQKGHVIFVEREYDAKNPNKIVSIGNHFYYRWLFMDSVRRQDRQPEARPILRPLEVEKGGVTAGAPATCGAPEMLSGARLLFGYTGDNEGSKGIGEDDFEHMAGRLAFNIAVEVVEEGDARFLAADRGFCVPLKELGAPRPSAYEHYLEQDRGTYPLRTYGDLHGEQGGELAGRKFYWHQPNAVNDPGLYRSDETKDVANNRATLARFVSAPGRRFRFTLRFRDLRKWELGAVLFALSPSVESAAAIAPANGSARKVVDEARRAEGANEARNAKETKCPAHPAFALKLGHGRPLGLGSVGITIDRVRRLDATGALACGDEMRREAETAWSAKASALDSQWKSDVFAKWLDLHRYAGRSKTSFPPDGKAILEYHQAIRKAHAKARRQKLGN